MSQKQQHVALAYDKKGKLLSIGYNSYIRTHTIQAKYARKVGKPDSVYIHAEIDALIKARGRKVHKIHVMRILRDGTYAMSKPCPICRAALKDFNVKEVGWT